MDERLRKILKLLNQKLRSPRGSAGATKPREMTWNRLRDYLQGDMVGNTKQYWRGRKPKDLTSDDFVRNIVVDDEVNPCINRFVSHALGKDWEWQLSAGEVVLRKADGKTVELTEFHKTQELWSKAKVLMRKLLGFGQVFLRVYIPEEYGEWDEDVQASVIVQGQAMDLEQALLMLQVQVLDESQAGLIEDEHGRELAYYYLFSKLDPDGVKQRQFLELHTQDFVRVFSRSGSLIGTLISEVENPFWDESDPHRRHFTMRRVVRDEGSILTSSILDLQDTLNVSRSNLKRNDDTGGFRQVAITNAQPPVDAEGKPTEWVFGPQRVLEIQGIDNGNNGVASPDVTVIEPVDPEYFTKAADDLRFSIRDKFNQTWTLAKFASASGDSKAESRAAFDEQLELEAQPVVDACQWLIKTSLMLASWLVSEEQLQQAMEIDVSARFFLRTAQADLNLYRELRAAQEKNQLSLETLLENTPGVTEPDLEAERIKKQQVEKDNHTIEFAKRQAEIAAPTPPKAGDHAVSP